MPNLIPLLCALWACADPPSTPAAPAEVVSALETALGDAIAKAEPSVVAIARNKNEDGDETTAVRGRNPSPPSSDPRVVAKQPGPLGGEVVAFDYGSGVVIGDAGEILTAFHVVKGAARLEVRAVDRQSFEAEVIAADPRSDLAVIVPREIPGVAAPKLRPLPIGDAGRLRRGAFLVALGNPFNAAARDGQPSASWGILSNLSRRLEPTLDEFRERRVHLRHYPTLLQLDAKLNLGMSGGAVVNLKGELVGLTTSLASVAGFDAMAGYAIPMDILGRRIVEALKQGKEFEYGLLGIQLDPLGSNKVERAQPGTPADEGNVLVNDQILAVGEFPVRDADSLVLAINAMPAGTRVRLKIQRQDQTIERTVELAKFRVDGEVIATNRPAPWRGLHVDYSSLRAASAVGDTLDRVGVLVTEVESESPADKAGLKKDQIIRTIEGQRVKTPRDFRRVVGHLDGPVTLGTDLGPVTIK
jgi:S1-C subfamily serine protease